MYTVTRWKFLTHFTAFKLLSPPPTPTLPRLTYMHKEPIFPHFFSKRTNKNTHRLEIPSLFFRGYLCIVIRVKCIRLDCNLLTYDFFWKYLTYYYKKNASGIATARKHGFPIQPKTGKEQERIINDLKNILHSIMKNCHKNAYRTPRSQTAKRKEGITSTYINKNHHYRLETVSDKTFEIVLNFQHSLFS